MKLALAILVFCFMALLAAAQSDNSAPADKPAAQAAPKPLPSLTVGGRVYLNVTLKAAGKTNATILHDAGIKNIPVSSLSLDQMKALNGTTTLASIDLTKVDPNPISPEVLKQVDHWIAQAGGVNRRLEDGDTPLIEAVLTGRPDYVKVVLKMRADPNAVNKDGHTAWYEAAIRGYTEIAGMLENAGAKIPDLIGSAQAGDEDIVKLFLAKDPTSTETTDALGRTVIMVAARVGQDQVVELLAEKGASLDARDNAGKTAIIHAAETGKTQTGRILIEKGVDVNARDQKGVTALMAATESGSLEMMTILIDHGAKIRAVDRSEGRNSLMLAARKNNKDAVELLLERGARPDAIDRVGKTARQHALECDHGDLAALLLEAEEDAGKIKAEKRRSFKRVLGIERALQGEEEARRAALPRYVPFLLWAGLIITAMGHVWLTLIAIQDGLAWGLVVLFFNPLGGAAYCFVRVRGAMPVLAIYLAGILIMGIPAWLFDVNLLGFYI